MMFSGLFGSAVSEHRCRRRRAPPELQRHANYELHIRETRRSTMADCASATTRLHISAAPPFPISEATLEEVNLMDIFLHFYQRHAGGYTDIDGKMDIGTNLFAQYYKQLLKVGASEPPLPNVSLPSRPSYTDHQEDEELYKLFCGISNLESSIEAVRVVRDPHLNVGRVLLMCYLKQSFPHMKA